MRNNFLCEVIVKNDFVAVNTNITKFLIFKLDCNFSRIRIQNFDPYIDMIVVKRSIFVCMTINANSLAQTFYHYEKFDLYLCATIEAY